MTFTGPDAGILKQWEAKVARWANQGKTREEILYSMTEANWAYADAEQLIRRVVGRERRKYGLLLLLCGFLAVLGVISILVTLSNPNGGVFYLPIGGTVGAIYFLIRLVKIRA